MLRSFRSRTSPAFASSTWTASRPSFLAQRCVVAPRFPHDTYKNSISLLPRLSLSGSVIRRAGRPSWTHSASSSVLACAFPHQRHERINFEQVPRIPQEGKTKDQSKGKAEELLAVAWSVRLDTWPYSPVLAVAGEGAKIFVYNIEPPAKGETMLNVWLDRTLVGHGRVRRSRPTSHQLRLTSRPLNQRVWSLKFSFKYPHLLLSASDDRTVILWDPFVLGGANDDLFKACAARDPRASAAMGKPIPYSRPFVPGEVLAKLAESPHAEPVFSVVRALRFSWRRNTC